MKVAKWWGMMPWDYRKLHPDYRSELKAIYTAEELIRRYYETEQTRIDRKDNDKGR